MTPRWPIEVVSTGEEKHIHLDAVHVIGGL
jgi:hypothetical protein